MMQDYPNVRFLFITLTVRNCEVKNLRQTLDMMCKAWWRLTHLRAWPAMGGSALWKLHGGKDGSAHPHYHCLLMVRPMYFQGDYLTAEAMGQTVATVPPHQLLAYRRYPRRGARP